MNRKAIKAIELHLETKAHEADEEAREALRQAIAKLDDAEGEEAIGFLLDAVAHIGEARGFRNAAHDVSQGEIDGVG